MGRRILNRPSSIPQKYQNTFEEGPKVKEMKHIRLPALPTESQLTFELIHFLHIVLLTFLSYLNFYRSVWWNPQSFNNNGMNFYLIDIWVIVIILLVEFRRILFYFTNIVISSAIILSIIAISIYNIEFNLHQILYLSFPLVVHFNVHGFKPEKLYDRSECENKIGLHICSDAYTLRSEAEELRNLFNLRIKSVLASSFISAYFSCFIPWVFVQQFIHYDLPFVILHFVLSWMILFSFIASRSFKPEFNDACHKVACHLGKWTRLRPNHIPSNIWTGESVEPNQIVKHQRELYKAEGIILVASEPGNLMHSRFQTLFTKGFLTRLVLGFHLSIIIILVIIVLRVTEWYQLISTSFLVFTCLFTLTRLGRDFLVTWKIYEAEELIMNCT